MGWVGSKEELSFLTKEIFENSNDDLKGYAISSLRQIWYKNKRLKKAILKIYYKILESERPELIDATTIVCVQEILQRKFGIIESKYGEISGNINLAKSKAKKALEKELI